MEKSDYSTEINRELYEPAYLQLVNIIKHQIASGVFRPGDQLPSESKLCRKYGVSPMTVRRAINILNDEGIVTTYQGRGTFVRAIKLGAATFQLKELQKFFSDRKNNKVKILQADIVYANEKAIKKMKVSKNSRLIHIRRLLLRNKKPFIYHREFLIYDPKRPVVENELEVTSLRGLFDGTGSTEFKYGDLSIEVTVLNEEEAFLLNSQAGKPAFCIEHIFYDFNEKPVSWGSFICRGDQLRFTTSIGVCNGGR